jgi:hypothetical protein
VLIEISTTLPSAAGLPSALRRTTRANSRIKGLYSG